VADIVHLAKTWFKPRRSLFYFAVCTGLPMSSFALPEMEGAYEYAGKDGNVQNLQIVSGHPLLAPAAIEAVKQWRYKPFLLNGQPVEVETTVTVNFRVHSE